YIRNRWGWMPGPVRVRPVYAPALVAFVGGSGFSLSINVGGVGPVGWFPLGPRDVYVPWFHASRRYFTNVNVTNIRNVYVNRTVINNYYSDYRAGRMPARGGHDYAYRRMPGAVTAVPRNVFAGALPVRPAVLKLNRTQLERSEVALRPGVNPGKASVGLRRPTMRPTVLKGREPFVRPVVARHQPPPRPVDFAAREKIIAQQHGQPLTRAQMQDLRKARPAAEQRNGRVKLVPAVANVRRAAAPGRPSEPAARNQPARTVAAPRPAEPSSRRASPANPPPMNAVRPRPPRKQPAAQRPAELPSARFAHPGERGTLPRAPVIRPASEPERNEPAQGRLPVVRPVERVPQPTGNGTVQQQRQAATQPQQREQQRRQLQEQTQQREREQQVQQQRQAQMQSQQREREQAARRAREQQMQQQRQAQSQQREREQAVQRTREQQMQQQRQAQSQQREREQATQQQRQIQQQRSMQMQQQQRAMEMQRQQQREVQRAPQRYTPPTRNRPAPEHREPPPRKHPPPSS